MSKILIAEHNAATKQYLTKNLKNSGNTVHVAQTGTDTWKAISSDEYDVIMIDIVMPGLDGFVLAQKALQNNPCTQIIFITGFAAVAMDTYNTPAYAPRPLTSKPFHLTEMAARVRFLMGEGELPATYSSAVLASDNNVVYAEFGAQKTG